MRIGDVACGTAELQRILERLAAMLEAPQHDEALERRAVVREQRVGVADADPRGGRNVRRLQSGMRRRISMIHFNRSSVVVRVEES